MAGTAAVPVLRRQRVQHSEAQRFDRRSLQAVHTALARASMADGAPLAEVVVDPPGAGALARVRFNCQQMPGVGAAAPSAAMLVTLPDAIPRKTRPDKCCMHYLEGCLDSGTDADVWMFAQEVPCPDPPPASSPRQSRHLHASPSRSPMPGVGNGHGTRWVASHKCCNFAAATAVLFRQQQVGSRLYAAHTGPLSSSATGGMGGKSGAATAGNARLALFVGNRQDDGSLPAVSQAAAAQPQVNNHRCMPLTGDKGCHLFVLPVEMA